MNTPQPSMPFSAEKTDRPGASVQDEGVETVQDCGASTGSRRIEQAEARTVLANTRTEEAEVRTEQAEMQGEQAIRASELRYRRLFETAQVGILILDAENGQVMDANPFMRDLLGYSQAEFLGLKLWEIGPFKGVEASRRVFAELQHADRKCYEEMTLEAKDGQRVDIEFVSNAYFVDKDRFIQCNIRNITERKQAEEEIRALNTELEAFSYSVSHDLRAPLRHIVGFVELLQQDAGPLLSEKSLKYLKTISGSAKRMGDLIDDLLAFSRVGRSELEKTEVDLDALVREIRGDFQIETKGRDVAWKIPPLPSVRADRALLRMALVNLFSNAIKFTGTRDHAEIDVDCRSGDEGETVLFVKDNGVGFDPLYMDKLFGVFQRLHRQTEFEGTGIGLANVKRIIHRHGGRVWAEGLVGGGAVFYISIPK